MLGSSINNSVHYLVIMLDAQRNRTGFTPGKGPCIGQEVGIGNIRTKTADKTREFRTPIGPIQISAMHLLDRRRNKFDRRSYTRQGKVLAGMIQPAIGGRRLISRD